jgi:hypothetical protein
MAVRTASTHATRHRARRQLSGRGCVQKMMRHWIVPEKAMTPLWLMSSDRFGTATARSICAHTEGVDTVKMTPINANAVHTA